MPWEWLADVVGDLLEDGEAEDLAEEGLEHSAKSILKRALQRKRAFVLKKKNQQNLATQLLHDGVSKSLVQRHQQNQEYYKSQTNYGYHYLSDEYHSDETIRRIRIRNKWENKAKKTMLVTMELKFIKGPNKTYTYHRVPLSVFMAMCTIRLTYMTKNLYQAGAWNFFWYAWWYKQTDNKLMAGRDLKSYAKIFRFEKGYRNGKK